MSDWKERGLFDGSLGDNADNRRTVIVEALVDIEPLDLTEGTSGTRSNDSKIGGPEHWIDITTNT